MLSVVGASKDGYYSEEERLEAAGPPDLLDDELDRFEIFMPAVQSLVNALGGYEELETTAGAYETIYRPGDSVLAVLKDLKKLWRKDDMDDERTVARCMARAGLMKELIALLVECTDRGEWGRKVALVACDLIAALTWPIDVVQELKEMEDEPGVVTDYASLLRAQREYKAMILQTTGPLRCLIALMLPSLAKPRKDGRDERVISLGLHIVRNLLAIKDAIAEGTATGEKEELANLQSTLILQLNKLTYFQLILTLASCADKSDFNQYNVLVLDILHLIFRSVRARDLAQDQARAPIQNLTKLLDAERRHKSLLSKVGMTRHSRFGTTVAVKAGDQQLVLHKQNAISVNPGKILDEVKRKRAGKMKNVDDLTHVVNLSPDAMRVLQNLAKTLIRSCFNTFFASILKDIRMERSKIRDTDNTRTFYLARFFIEYLLQHREADTKQKGVDKGESEALALGLVAEMAELDSVRFVFGRMRLTMDDRPSAWTELQACLDCFTQIVSLATTSQRFVHLAQLLLLDAMSASEVEDDVEVAEILQHQLYYNGDILDSSLTVISQYKDQSVAYLDSVIHFAYVLLRNLEKYSKRKVFMFVRKRKAARKKRKLVENGSAEPSMPEEYAGEEDGDGDAHRDTPSYAEHQFAFAAFEKRFAQEAVVNTLMAYLSRYRELEEPEQVKRVVGLMHRQVIKTQAEGLYYKVSYLNLFRRVLDEQQSLPTADSSQDLVRLIKFVVSKFFKRVATDPFLVVQALGPKSRGHWKELSSYKSDDESDDGMGGQKSRIKEKLAMGPPELEFKKNKKLSWSQQMGVVVAMLVQAGHEDWIRWVIEVLEIALAARTEIVVAVDGPNGAPVNGDERDEDDERRVRDFAGPSRDAIAKFAQADVALDNDERRATLARDADMRLMLKLLAFDRTDDELAADQKWFLPSTVLPSSITASLGALNHFLTAPPSLDDDPKSLLRRVHKRARRAPSASGSGSDQEDRPKKIRKKKQAETQIFKSAAFIVDSDDDEEADAAFFAKERELRAEMEALAAKHGTSMLVTGTRERKRKGNGKGKEVDGEATQILGIDEEDKEIRATGPAGYTQPDGSVSSASESEGDGLLKRRVSGKTRRTSSMSDSDGDSEDRPTQAKLKPGRARLVDSEEDE